MNLSLSLHNRHSKTNHLQFPHGRPHATISSDRRARLQPPYHLPGGGRRPSRGRSRSPAPPHRTKSRIGTPSRLRGQPDPLRFQNERRRKFRRRHRQLHRWHREQHRRQDRNSRRSPSSLQRRHGTDRAKRRSPLTRAKKQRPLSRSRRPQRFPARSRPKPALPPDLRKYLRPMEPPVSGNPSHRRHREITVISSSAPSRAEPFFRRSGGSRAFATAVRGHHQPTAAQ